MSLGTALFNLAATLIAVTAKISFTAKIASNRYGFGLIVLFEFQSCPYLQF
jgi:hypothetical protein